jgi:hypothetical protein
MTANGTRGRDSIMRLLTLIRLVGFIASLILTATVTPAAVAAVPANDNFESATIIDPSALPFAESADNSDATTEPGEPFNCFGLQQTIWYVFTPDVSGAYRADLAGSPRSDGALLVWRQTSSGLSGLSFVGCTQLFVPSAVTFTATAGETYYLQAGDVFGGLGSLQVNLVTVPPPQNDDLADATPVSTVPYTDNPDLSAATMEPGEPSPSLRCINFPPVQSSVWYAFTPGESGYYIAATSTASFFPVVTIYAGSGFGDMVELTCGSRAFRAEAGTTYYLQLSNIAGPGGGVSFFLNEAPPPQARFDVNPSDPSVFDSVEFRDGSFDPGGNGFETEIWNLGDGTSLTNPGFSFAHTYQRDGDYTVELAVRTVDGRTASTSRVVSVRTHDVAIKSFTVPKAAQAGQTRAVSVGIVNTRYPEPVQVQLFKSVPGGFQQIGSLTQDVPVRGANRTTTFGFTYTFTAADAAVGKVTFKAVAVLTGARDALPADNEAVGSPTKVT